MSSLCDTAADVLADDGVGPMPAVRLLKAIRAAGIRQVNAAILDRALERDKRFVRADVLGRGGWELAAAPGPGEGSTSTRPAAAADAPQGVAGTRDRLDLLALRDWQAEALAAWSATGRGVVEAVTGTGKTRLAMAAIRIVADRGGRSLVLAPTLELQDQWVRELRTAAPDLRVGRLGGGNRDDLYERDVVVSTPHSAASVPIEPPPGTLGLLVADEAHRYGAPTWGAALHEAFPMRLALTATYERNDDGLVDVLAPYFGGVVHRYDYDRAVADGTVAPFRIATVGVRLRPDERDAYDRADARARQLHRELVGGLGMPKDPRKLFAAVSAVVATAGGQPGMVGSGGGAEGTQVRACREYLVRVRERREIAAACAGKLAICAAAAPGLKGRRSLVFTDTVEQAEDAAAELVRAGVHAETIHGGLADDKRRIRLAQFRRGRIDALVAPRVLDEGVDVPDADVALVLAAFRTRRQLIQRLGRVLRLKDDGRAATLLLGHAVDTHEDPARGGHADFLRQVRDVALEVVEMDLDQAGSGGVDARPGDLVTWLGTPTTPGT
ncbi:MAG: DEAD/DEAH box helicase [Actinobacteria bacterium]|jgi:RNA polymerase primary sigma factor|nr:DEAD/DEAH box helicase [Actinomycetota bacterium]